MMACSRLVSNCHHFPSYTFLYGRREFSVLKNLDSRTTMVGGGEEKKGIGGISFLFCGWFVTTSFRFNGVFFFSFHFLPPFKKQHEVLQRLRRFEHARSRARPHLPIAVKKERKEYNSLNMAAAAAANGFNGKDFFLLFL